MSEKELHLKSMEKRRLSSNTTQPSAAFREHAAREVARLEADFHKVYGDFQVELASSPIEEQEVIALRYLSRCVDLHGKWLDFAVPVRDGMKLYVEFLEYAIQTYLLPEIERMIRPVFGDDGAARARVMIEGHKNQWIACMKKARLEAEQKPRGRSPVSVEAWKDLLIEFVSDDRIQVTVRDKDRETFNCAEFGFEDRRNGSPNQAWHVLKALAENKGVLASERAAGMDRTKVEKAIQSIKKALKTRYGCSSNPIPIVKGAGYQAQFRITTRPSYNT